MTLHSLNRGNRKCPSIDTHAHTHTYSLTSRTKGNRFAQVPLGMPCLLHMLRVRDSKKGIYLPHFLQRFCFFTFLFLIHFNILHSLHSHSFTLSPSNFSFTHSPLFPTPPPPHSPFLHSYDLDDIPLAHTHTVTLSHTTPSILSLTRTHHHDNDNDNIIYSYTTTTT